MKSDFFRNSKIDPFEVRPLLLIQRAIVIAILGLNIRFQRKRICPPLEIALYFKPLKARIYLLGEAADSVFGFPRLSLIAAKSDFSPSSKAAAMKFDLQTRECDREEVRLRPVGLAGGTDDSAAAERGNKAVNHRFGDH